MNKIIKNYLLLCFSINYVSWGTLAVYSRLNNVDFDQYAWMYVLYIVGVLSPAISAVFVQIKYEHHTIKEVAKHIFKLPRYKTDWFLLLGVVAIFEILPYLLFGKQQTSSFLSLLIYIPIFFFVGGFEEIGWRGLWLDHILADNKLSKFKAALIIGLVWEAWHLPLFVMLGTYQQQYLNVGIHTLWTLALSFALAALYIRGRSVLLCMIAHCLINSFGNMLILRVSWIEAIIKLSICVIFFFVITYTDGKRALPAK